MIHCVKETVFICLGISSFLTIVCVEILIQNQIILFKIKFIFSKIKQILTHFYIKYTINPQINTKKDVKKMLSIYCSNTIAINL